MLLVFLIWLHKTWKLFMFNKWYIAKLFLEMEQLNHLPARLVVYLLNWDFSVSLISWICLLDIKMSVFFFASCLSKLFNPNEACFTCSLDTHLLGRSSFCILNYLRKIQTRRTFHFLFLAISALVVECLNFYHIDLWSKSWHGGISGGWWRDHPTSQLPEIEKNITVFSSKYWLCFYSLLN